MKENNKKIEEIVAEIQSRCRNFLSTVKSLGNHCAWTDRKVEGIIDTSKKLEKVYKAQFEEPENKTNILSKKVKEMIKECVEEECECGHTICGFDDYDHDLREIADVIGVEMIEDEDEEGWTFKNEKDKVRTEKALHYYYELHS